MTNLLVFLFEAEFNANCLTILGLVLVIYDHLLTLNMEIEYFWHGSWSLSRILFLLTRYLSPLALLLNVLCTFANMSEEACAYALHAVLLVTYIVIIIVQAIVVLRIWYILSSRRVARAVVVLCFLIMVGVTAHALASIYPKFNPVVYSQKGCAPPDVVGDFWRVYVPDLVLQTIVFGATLWPAVELWRRGQHSQLLTRVVRDGGLFYVVVFTAVAFTAIGSLQQKSFPVMLAAAYSDLLLAVSCVAVSRLMLSIHSLASHLSMDLSMLLSTAELSRIRWKRGMHDGELIVEIDTVEGVELDGLMGSSENLRAPAVHMSTVGAYADAFPLELRRDISTAGASAQYAKR